ncbi:MAG: 1,2-phenylacetyl-CoA epoxidase subunit PaaE [Pseudomonadota bacterium]
MSHFHPLTIASVVPESNSAIALKFEVPDGLSSTFQFKPGQYLTLKAKLDGEEVRRSYSICSAVQDEGLTVGIKKIDGGQFSTHANEQFKPGDTIDVMPPQGEMTVELNASAAKNYLCIAAGSGITPILSIIKSVLIAEPDSQVTLLYGNRGANTMMFRETLSWIKNAWLERFLWINIYSREQQDAEILNGRLNNRKGGELNEKLISLQSYDEFYLCGPEGMISEVTRGLRGLGIADSQIHFELFFASAEDAKQAMQRHHERAAKYAGKVSQVSVRADGRESMFELTADGENILDAAMENGVDLPFSCKGGVCATCKARLLVGKVDMDLHHGLSDEEIDSGYILTCQAHPISETVRIDFDQ